MLRAALLPAVHALAATELLGKHDSDVIAPPGSKGRGTPKYVFQGISEFAINPPEIITGDNYESGRGVRSEGGAVGVPVRQGRLFDQSVTGPIHINIFNISKINSELRGGAAPRIKRLSEYIGESYFEYLSKLDDLVMLMDESHRYRASAGVRAINELRPILGLELTATPQVEVGSKPLPFKNVIYSYPLSSALADGFVKEPAVATRENFDPEAYDEKGLERLKLEDGVRIHENTKVELEVYALENGKPIVKPFMLVVAQDTDHASALLKAIEDVSFFEGRYKGKVITVHSNLRGEEKDETVQQLLSVESRDNPVEIVIHVNMLKEGWDVTNLYTIVPLRAANSRTLVEQSIGRGLRLPYGKRAGVPAVDRLTIVSHDKFQEIVDHANEPDSIIRTGIVIGRDIPGERMKTVVFEPSVMQRLTGEGAPPAVGGAKPAVVQTPLFTTPREQEVARATLHVIREFERLPRSADLMKPNVQAQIVDRVRKLVTPAQGHLEGIADDLDVAKIVAQTVEVRNALSIDIPRISVVPKGEVTSGFTDFDLDVDGINLQPVDHQILIQHLHERTQYRLASGDGIVPEERLEDYLVRGLIDFDDICYDSHAELLYKLAGQVVKRLQSYLKESDDVLNVLQYHQQTLVHLIHAQMQAHYEESATNYEAEVTHGFVTLRPKPHQVPADAWVRDFRAPVTDKLRIRQMLFGGFIKSLYPIQKFDSDAERRFAVILEDDCEKWFKPSKGDFRIYYQEGAEDSEYIPDFAVEARSAKYLCEPKAADEITDPTVQAKARAAATWCQHATQHENAHGGKPWSYLLIPHDRIDENQTLRGLAASYTIKPVAAP